MSDWRDMIPAPLAAPETAERRAARLRVIAGFVVFAVMVLFFASLRALIGSLALPLLVATATFGYIVKQHCNKKRAPRLNFRHCFSSNWRSFKKCATFNPMQNANCFQRVFINCITVIHVKLHHSHNTSKVR